MNRFNLEDNITAAWSHTERDIENILAEHYDGIQPVSADILHALKLNHNLRMKRVWSTFEQIIKDQSFDPPIGEDCEPEIGNPYDNTLGVQGESKC